jgi:hypothetical protein
MPPHADKVLLPCLNLLYLQGGKLSKIIRPANFQPHKDGEWKLKISYFFVISRGTTLSKSMDHNQIQTWPAHSNDISTHSISTLYMHPIKSLREETKNFLMRNNYVKKKLSYQDQICAWTWPMSFYDVSKYQIWIKCVQPLQR